jgi:hypothetical protein
MGLLGQALGLWIFKSVRVRWCKEE